jgi:dihydropteroate synthase
MVQRETKQYWKCRDRTLAFGERPLIMGILNVTPDSFSDGGRHFETQQAVDWGLRMADDGADILDVGGESTRPGAAEVSPEEEAARVVPVVEALHGKTEAAISVDTMKAPVARQALDVGACIINDVSALSHDPDMPAAARDTGAGVVLMHMQGTPRTMQQNPRYDDVVAEVAGFLESRVAGLVAEGLDRDTMAVDPGIGFGKTVAHNVELLARLDALKAIGVPVVVGLSRKSFLGKLTGREVDERLAGSLSALVFCLLNGADVMRVHDVRESLDAMKVAGILDGRKRGEDVFFE